MQSLSQVEESPASSQVSSADALMLPSPQTAVVQSLSQVAEGSTSSRFALPISSSKSIAGFSSLMFSMTIAAAIVTPPDPTDPTDPPTTPPSSGDLLTQTAEQLVVGRLAELRYRGTGGELEMDIDSGLKSQKYVKDNLDYNSRFLSCDRAMYSRPRTVLTGKSSSSAIVS